MKKLFEIIGLLSLASFSFFITERTTTVFENLDNIMLQIKENSYKYNVESVDAIILNDTIIPGIYGRVVDVKKSYKKMKKHGAYNDNYFVYKHIKPNISLSNNLDKCIVSGNKNNRNVSLIFKVNDSISRIVDILNNNNIKGNFFIDNNYFDENNEEIIYLINNGHTIGNLGNNLDYSTSSFGWMDTIIKSLTNQKQGYCYYTNNKDNEKFCINYKNYIIKPIEINNNFLYEVKNKLSNGVMLSFDINSKIIKELDSIIKFIKSKGYNIVTIDNLLKEDNDISNY